MLRRFAQDSHSQASLRGRPALFAPQITTSDRPRSAAIGRESAATDENTVNRPPPRSASKSSDIPEIVRPPLAQHHTIDQFFASSTSAIVIRGLRISK
jgi:hypothetical protein